MSKWYVEQRYNDRGKVFVNLVAPDEAEDFDTTPVSYLDGYDRYVDGFDTEQEARDFMRECKEA